VSRRVKKTGASENAIPKLPMISAAIAMPRKPARRAPGVLSLPT
jgi:hypothetical protein